MTDVDETRAGFCAILGAPNAGKSTLLNAAVGAKVSIVSHKVQTTRAAIRGVAIRGRAQIVFVDTPGVFEPKRRLDRAMVRAAWGGAADADAIVVMVDAERGRDRNVDRIVAGLKEGGRRAVLALNKIDLVPRNSLLALAENLDATGVFSDIFMISALNRDGVDDLLEHVAAAMPAGPWLYPEDQIADAPMRFLAAEVTREKLYERLHQELPYHSTVETENWEERRDGSVKVDQVIYVARAGQKGIVLGKGGATVKEIGRLAREELAAMLERPVHLFLFVKVRERWADDPERYREMGLDFSE